MRPGLLPTGTVTFLFTDIEGSTPLQQKFPAAMRDALARHHAILRDAIAANDGHVFNVIGDAFCAAFSAAPAGATAALAAQRALNAAPWGETGPLRVRMGLHTGEAEAVGDDYAASLTLVRAQRLMSAGRGGQTLVSPSAAEILREQLPPDATLRDLGAYRLRGLAQPERIFQLDAPGAPTDFPPLRVPESFELESETAVLLEQLERGRLVGRAREVLQLHERWDLAMQGHGQLVLISGEPGVGKTRLAHDLVMHARDKGATILKGGSYEYEASTAYLPFVEALRDWVRACDGESLRAALGSTASEIAKLAPEIETKLPAMQPNPALPPSEERSRLFDNVARLLQRLSAAHGLLLVIDDLHWADQGTLSLLHYLLRHLRNERFLVLAAYRDVELDRAHPLAASLVEWNRQRLATRISLGRLSQDATGALLAALFGESSISAGLTGAMYRETEGNPFFLEEVVKSLIEQGQIFRANGRWERKDVSELAIPQSVKEAIGRRLNRLSEATTDVLHAAAAVGKRFPFSELALVVTASEDQLLDALDEACAAQLLRAEADDWFAFTHDKIREVLYEELNPIRRRRLHQRIGEALEAFYARDDSHAPDLAHHFSESGDLARSLRYSTVAARQMEALFAYTDALRYYERSLECAESLELPDQLALLHGAIGDVHAHRGQYGDVFEHYQRALALTPTAEARAALKSKMGATYVHVGDARGLAMLREALQELDPATQVGEMARATAMIGRHHHNHAQHTQALEYLERARALAEPLDDTHMLLQIYMYIAGAHQHFADYDRADEWARRLIELGERKNNPEAIGSGYEYLAENAVARGNWRDVLSFAAEDRRIADKIGALDRFGWSEMCRASALRNLGDLTEAAAAARQGVSLSEKTGDLRLAVFALAVLACIATDMEDDEEARTAADSGIALADQLGHVVLRCFGRDALGYHHLQREEWTRAVALYEECSAIMAATENGMSKLNCGAHAIEADMRAGHGDRARQRLPEHLALVRASHAAHWEAVTFRLQGQLLAADGALDDAQRVLDESVATLERLESRIELGRALLARAVLRHRRGDPGAARADGERARGLFMVARAPRDIVRADGFLSRLPAGAP